MKTFIWSAVAVVFATMASCSSDDSGNGGGAIEKACVSGIIEKGPFVQGSKVLLYELENDLTQTGKSFRTQTSSDLGAFSFTPDKPMQLSSQYVELETSGYFYNEVKGALSSAPITLNAISNVAVRSSVNVNLLTHLEFDRVKRLVREGKDFNAAKKQAERELLACFGITTEIANPEAVSITDNNKNSAILLAISTIMLYDRSEAEFSELIAQFASDFADNGRIDNEHVRNAIKEGEGHAHPSEVITKMKDFYNNKGIAFECDDFSKYVDFNGDGVIDGNDVEGTSIVPENDVVVEEYWASEQDVRSVLMACYTALTSFVNNQVRLENMRTKPAEDERITSHSSQVSSAFSDAYKTINYVNVLLKYSPEVHLRDPYYTESEAMSTEAQARLIRAFVYYNLAMMWGNVPMITVPIVDDTEDYRLPQTQQEEVYQFAYSEICNALKYLPTRYVSEMENKCLFTRVNALMLKAEIELTLNMHSAAAQTLAQIDSQQYQGDLQISNGLVQLSNLQPVIFALAMSEKNVARPIYTNLHLQMFQREANGETLGLETAWKEGNLTDYGYWTALKRLGKAQTVTGCRNYELLFPFYYTELRLNPNMVQNPGYEEED